MLKSKNVLTRFREFFKSLSHPEQKELWDVLTALRGSDAGVNDDVKFATTARIRGEFLGERYSRGYVFLNLKQAKNEMQYTSSHRGGYKPHKVRSHYQDKPHHFQAHVRHAIDVLNRYRPKSSMRDLQKFLRRS